MVHYCSDHLHRDSLLFRSVLLSEAKLGGPVHYRWMYPIERYLMRLKSYVHNKAQHEGSMAESYVEDGCLTFCSRYFKGVKTPFNRPPSSDKTIHEKEMYILNSGGRKLGKVDILELDYTSPAQAHRVMVEVEGGNYYGKLTKTFGKETGHTFMKRAREEMTRRELEISKSRPVADELDTQDVEITLVDFRTLLNLPQVTENNKKGFVKSPELMTICEFLRIIGDEVKVQALGKFFIKHLHQSWQTLCKVLSRCLATRITGLQALVDKKKVVVTKATIRDALHLDDAEGVDCLLNEEIFTTLARMGYEKPSTKLTFYKAFFLSQWKFLIHTILQSMSAKRTLWNEFSSVMASAVICLSTGGWAKDAQGLKHLYLRIKLFNYLLHLLHHHNNLKIYHQHHTYNKPPPQQQSPPPSQPHGAYFLMSLLQEALDACTTLARRVEHLEHDKVAQDLEIIKLKSRVKKLKRANKVKTVKLKRLRKVRTSQRIESSDYTIMEDVSNQGRMIDESDKDEVSAAVVVQADVHAAPVNAAAVVTTAGPVKVVVPSTRRRRGVVIRDPKEESFAKTPTETKSKDKGKGIMVEEPKPMKKKQQVELDEAYARKLQEELNQDIDWEVAMNHVKQKAKENPYVQRYQVMKKRPQTKAQARRNMMVYLKNTAGFTLDYFKGMSYDDIRPIFESKFNENMEFLLEYKEQMEEEENRHLEIVPDKDDDVYTEATPLARKVPVVDYQIIHVNNKPRYKIIRVDNTHQLFGVDAAMEIKEKHQVFTVASEDITAARQKLILLVTATK
nr:hypothetical protein [Tanacetum cinerariifolium]